MTTYRFDPKAAAAAATVAALFAVGVPAAASTDGLPAAQTSGAVSYVTGGVGQHESQAFLQHRRDYPLAVEIYARDGGHEVYTAGASVYISTPRGETVLQAEADGPFLLADVPPGRYIVEVDRQGDTQRKPVTVGHGGASRAVFVFQPTRS